MAESRFFSKTHPLIATLCLLCLLSEAILLLKIIKHFSYFMVVLILIIIFNEGIIFHCQYVFSYSAVIDDSSVSDFNHISFCLYCIICFICCLVAQSCLTLLWTPWAINLQDPWDIPDKNTGIGCHFLQGIFLIQGSSLHRKWILYHWATGEAIICLRNIYWREINESKGTFFYTSLLASHWHVDFQ